MSDADTEYVLVTEYFHPEVATTGQLLTDLAVGLTDRGLDVTVYTGQPNYHSGTTEKQPRISRHQGVLVKRIRAPQLRQTSLARRLFNWSVFTMWMFFRLLLSRGADEREIIFVSNPPVLPVVLWPLCRLRGWEYTYIVHDVYPDAAVEAGFLSEEHALTRLWQKLQRGALADANHVVALGPAMRDRILELGGERLDADTVEVIHHWEDPSVIRPLPKEENQFAQEHDLVDTFTVLYSGNIGVNHDLRTLIQAAARLADRNIKFLIIGDGDKKAEVVRQAERLGVGETVTFLPYQPSKKLPETLTVGDVSVVSVCDGMKGVCVSSKLYTSLAAGAPVLVISDANDDEQQIVERHDAGIGVTSGDVDGVTTAIDTWMSNPELVDRQGSNARHALQQHYRKAQSIDQYYELLTGNAPETTA